MRDRYGEDRPRFEELLRHRGDLVLMSLTMIGVVYMVILYARTWELKPRDSERDANTAADARYDAISRRVTALSRELAAKGQPTVARVPETAILSEKLDALDVRLAALEDAIGASPEKALSVPLLRNDVQKLEARVTDSNASLRADFERVYDLLKWIVGGVLGGILILGVPMVVQAFRKGDKT